MAVFGVFIKESTQDQSQLDIYSSKAGPSLAGHAVKVPLIRKPESIAFAAQAIGRFLLRACKNTPLFSA
jgi:hypothetical protein